MAIKTKPLTVLKSVGPKLVPFLKTLAIYFVLYGDNEGSTPSLLYCIIKCLPIISLIFFVLLHGMNFSDAYSYSRRIVLGLTFCVIGDAFLVWKETYFVHGVTAFAVGQVLYASAFGFRPFNPYAGAVLASIGGIVFTVIAPGVDGVMNIVVPIYLFLIFVMGWRAVARVQLFDDLWTWTKLCGCAGALCFLVSDFIIAVDKFRFEVPYSHQMIMITYYAAQLGITLSVVDSQVDSLIEHTSKDNGYVGMNGNNNSFLNGTKQKLVVTKQKIVDKLNHIKKHSHAEPSVKCY